MSNLLIDINDLKTLTAFSESTIRRRAKAKDGKFPKPRQIGRCVRWVLAEVEAWIAAGCPV